MMKRLALLLLLAISAIFAQTEWTVSFTVETSDSSVFVRGFGVADGASDGYDILNDIPVFVGADDTLAFFPVSGAFVTALSTDIRSALAAEHEWELAFQNMPFSSVNWTLDSLPTGGTFEVSVCHPDSTPDSWSDMRVTIGATVDEGMQVRFRWSIPTGEDSIPPFVTSWSPSDGSVGVLRETDIYCEVHDDDSGVDIGSISLDVNGIGVTWLAEIDSIAGGFSVSYNPPLDFGFEAEVTVILSANDLETPANFMSDTVIWWTAADSLSHTVVGTVGTGDPLVPIEGAVVTLAGKADSTDADGYFTIDSVSDGMFTIQASAEGYDNTNAFIGVYSDTTVVLVLDPSEPPEVLLIDYDSGITPFFDGADSVGEDVIVADLLESTGYSYVKTAQNPNIDTLRFSDYQYIIVITPVRTAGSHAIIPATSLDLLAAWLEDDGRLLWIAPDAGTDYAGADFFDLFGSVFESGGRPAEPTGNVAALYGEPKWFFLTVNADYDNNSPADNYLDEFSPADSNTHAALASQDSAPPPSVATGRVMFRDVPEYRAVLSSILFGGIEDGFFPNNKTTIFRACMDFLSNEYGVDEAPLKPSDMAIFAYPNPFNSTVSIVGLTTPVDVVSVIEIFDVSGRSIARFTTQSTTAEWSPDGSVGSGLYLIRESSTGRTCRAIYLR